MSEKLFISAKEAAMMLGGISEALVYKMVKENRLRHMHIGRRIVIPISAIKELAQANSIVL
ncbi:MAG: helix-turn-helix domain-containing protein [Clostridia bacterium]|nr:helix-turn-helix domain-containing protein [Clostridia bacterium]